MYIVFLYHRMYCIVLDFHKYTCIQLYSYIISHTISLGPISIIRNYILSTVFNVQYLISALCFYRTSAAVCSMPTLTGTRSCDCTRSSVIGSKSCVTGHERCRSTQTARNLVTIRSPRHKLRVRGIIEPLICICTRIL